MQQTIEAFNLQQDLMTQGFSLVDHYISDESIDALVAAYANFTDNLPDPTFEDMNKLMLPGRDAAKIDKSMDIISHAMDDSKEWHKYRTSHPRFAKPGGYTNRSLQVATIQNMRGIKLQDDPKEYYHFHPDSLTQIIENHRMHDWGAVPPEVLTLHKRFSTVHQLAAVAIMNQFRLIEETHPELLTKYMTPNDIISSPLRMLFYHQGQGMTLAAGHYDKGAATLQVAESHHGLRIMRPDTQKMARVVRPPEKGVFFTATTLTGEDGIYSDSVLKPAWHDVKNIDIVNDGRKLYGMNCARWAIVFFLNCEYAGVPNKSSTHNRRV